jgi:hypothetical protein
LSFIALPHAKSSMIPADSRSRFILNSEHL